MTGVVSRDEGPEFLHERDRPFLNIGASYKVECPSCDDTRSVLHVPSHVAQAAVVPARAPNAKGDVRVFRCLNPACGAQWRADEWIFAAGARKK